MKRAKGLQKLFLLENPPLLKSESKNEFDAFCEALEREVKPRGPLQQMYFAELCGVCWEILRWVLAKTTIIDIGSRPALQHILEQIFGQTNAQYLPIGDNAQDVSSLYYYT